ncbi:MAG: MFS transporter [Clostridium sp.]|uniref:MFS transporter n=1 Tax=Clostridium sp. TaxID=1506 RepID=UPI003F3E803D
MTHTEEKRNKAKYITVFATFLAFMGIGVVDPLLPTIAASIGASSSQIELLFTAYIFTMAIMMIPAGILATKFGNKRLMVVGLGIVTIFALSCGLSNGILELSIFRAGWGLGNALFFATAMVLLIAFSDKASSAIGMYEAAIGLGMAGGPLVGGILGKYSWRLPFIATFILILIAFLLVTFFVYEPSHKTERKVAGVKELIKLIKVKRFIKVAIAGMFYYYGFFVVLAYTPLVLKIPTIVLGLVFCGWGLMLAFGSAVLSHKLEKKYEVSKILPWSLIIFAILLGILFLAHSTYIRIIVVILSGLVSGLNNALFTTHAMAESPYGRDITSGAYNFVRWLGAAIAPLLSGVISETIGMSTPFIIAAIIAVLAFILIKIKVKSEN